ncbi:MAG: hypothetical protein ACI4WH_02800 [Oscillospiraceae bacterium]
MTNQARRKKKKRLNHKGMVLCAILIILILIIPIANMSNSYKNVMKDYCKSIVKQDYQKYKSVFPAFVIENGLEDLMIFAYDTGENYMQTKYNSYVDAYGKNLKVSYKINDRTKLTKNELTQYSQSATAICTDGEEIEFKKGYNLNVTIKYKGKTSSNEEEVSVIVVKYDGDWYIYDGGIYFC